MGKPTGQLSCLTLTRREDNTMRAIDLANMILALPPEDQQRETEIEYSGYYAAEVSEVIKPFVDNTNGNVVIGRVKTVE